MTKILNNNILLLAKSQEFKEVLINEAIRALSSLSLGVKSNSVTAPPANPAADDFYLIPSNATGAWAGKTNKIAYPVIDVNGAVVSAQWNFYEPVGFIFNFNDLSFYYWNGSAWVKIGGQGDMTEAEYVDQGGTGIVLSALKISGVEAANNSTFYGKNNSGNIGFFTASITGQAAKTALESLSFPNRLSLDNLEQGVTNKYLSASQLTNLTLQGNSFNGNSQLIQTTLDGKIPALDGSLLTNLPTGGLTQDQTDKLAMLPLPSALSLGNGLRFNGSALVAYPLTNSDTFAVLFESPVTGTYEIAKLIKAGMIVSISAKSTSGTATFSVLINTNPITGLSSLNASATEINPSATANNSGATGNYIIINITSISSPTKLFIQVRVDY